MVVHHSDLLQPMAVPTTLRPSPEYALSAHVFVHVSLPPSPFDTRPSRHPFSRRPASSWEYWTSPLRIIRLPQGSLPTSPFSAHAEYGLESSVGQSYFCSSTQSVVDEDVHGEADFMSKISKTGSEPSCACLDNPHVGPFHGGRGHEAWLASASGVPNVLDLLHGARLVRPEISTSNMGKFPGSWPMRGQTSQVLGHPGYLWHHADAWPPHAQQF